MRGSFLCLVSLSMASAACGGTAVIRSVPSGGLSSILSGLPASSSAPRSVVGRVLDDKFRSIFEDERDYIHVQLDKSVVRPGEAIWFKIWHRRAEDFADSEAESDYVALYNSRDELIVTGYAEHGFGGITIPESAAGGVYELRSNDVVRSIVVRTFEAPRLRKTITLDKQGYEAGAEVSASVSLRRAGTDEPLANLSFRADLAVDDQGLPEQIATTDAQGQATVKFRLPAQIAQGSGRLTISVTEGGATEATQKEVPLRVGKVNLAFYPEGGNLVAGLPGRVYFEATTPLGEPVDIEGRVLDSKGGTVATLAGAYRGMGRFELIARAEPLRVVLDKPAGIRASYPLPTAVKKGCSLLSAELDDSRRDVRVGVLCTHDHLVHLAASMRNDALGTVSADVEALHATVMRLPIPDDKQGIVRVTLFSNAPGAVAERLLYRGWRPGLQIRVTPKRPGYAPGDEVELAVETRDASGAPVPAELSVVAVDQRALDLVSDQPASLAGALLLEAELGGQHVPDADHYLTEGPDRARDLDLLLGTRGWTRLTWTALTYAVKTTLEQDYNRATDHDFRDDELDGDLIMPCGECIDVRRFATGGGDLMPSPSKLSRPTLSADGPTAGPRLEPLVPVMLERPGTLAYKEWTLVREFAKPLPRSPNGNRYDFRDTIAFLPSVRTGDDGRATVRFHSNHSSTTFQARVEGIGAGQIGAQTRTFSSSLPVSLHVPVPAAVAVSDELHLPIVVSNHTDKPVRAQLTSRAGPAFELLRAPPPSLELAPSESKTVEARLRVGSTPKGSTDGLISLRVEAKGTFDLVTREVQVEHPGYPWHLARSGFMDLERGMTSVSLDVPALRRQTLSSQVAFYGDQIGTLTEDAAAMLRQPTGCFEQTSSKNYPNLLLLELIRDRKEYEEVEKRARELLAQGAKRLATFEIKGGGFSLFGDEPASVTLSALGLMQFEDMRRAGVLADSDIVERTRRWILEQRDGHGGFNHANDWGGSFSRGGSDSDAYILWALAESGTPLTRDERTSVIDRSRSNNLYELTLAANVLLLVEPDSQAALTSLKRLQKTQDKDGSIPFEEWAPSGAWGFSSRMEATALAALAFLRAKGGRFQGPAARAIAFLQQSRTSSGYGTTHASVLTMKAMRLYSQTSSGQLASVELEQGAQRRALAQGLPGHFKGVVDDFLSPGKSKLVFRAKGTGRVPWQLTASWISDQPRSSPDALVAVSTSLPKKLRVGQRAELRARVVNRTGDVLPMTMLHIGFPGGMRVEPFQLDRLVDTKAIAFYETQPRELILYIDHMQPRQELELHLDAIAEVGGKYTAPPSSAYLYYSDQDKSYAPPLAVEIDN